MKINCKHYASYANNIITINILESKCSGIFPNIKSSINPGVIKFQSRQILNS